MDGNVLDFQSHKSKKDNEKATDAYYVTVRHSPDGSLHSWVVTSNGPEEVSSQVLWDNFDYMAKRAADQSKDSDCIITVRVFEHGGVNVKFEGEFQEEARLAWLERRLEDVREMILGISPGPTGYVPKDDLSSTAQANPPAEPESDARTNKNQGSEKSRRNSSAAASGEREKTSRATSSDLDFILRLASRCLLSA